MMNDYLLIIVSSITAMLVCAMLIPAWMNVCRRWNLFERKDARKWHKDSIPTMGGIAMFAGISISFSVYAGEPVTYNSSLLIAATVTSFFTGFFDDLIDLKPSQKVVFQLLSAVLVIVAGFRIESLCGFAGIEQLPLVVSWGFTVFFILAVTNALNLIDGLDGLAGSLTFISSFLFGVLFIQAGDYSMATLSFCICGAVFGFLMYNFHPARIFMGDTGSLVLGFLLAVQAIALFQHYSQGSMEVPQLTPALIAAALFVPMYDVMRVSAIRMLTGYSPFHPDRNHIHHMIIGQGFGQRSTTVIIAAFSCLYVGIALLFPNMGITSFVILSVCLGMLTMNTLTMSWLALMYGRMGGRLYGRII